MKSEVRFKLAFADCSSPATNTYPSLAVVVGNRPYGNSIIMIIVIIIYVIILPVLNRLLGGWRGSSRGLEATVSPRRWFLLRHLIVRLLRSIILLACCVISRLLEGGLLMTVVAVVAVVDHLVVSRLRSQVLLSVGVRHVGTVSLHRYPLGFDGSWNGLLLEKSSTAHALVEVVLFKILLILLLVVGLCELSPLGHEQIEAVALNYIQVVEVSHSIGLHTVFGQTEIVALTAFHG